MKKQFSTLISLLCLAIALPGALRAEIGTWFKEFDLKMADNPAYKTKYAIHTSQEGVFIIKGSRLGDNEYALESSAKLSHNPSASSSNPNFRGDVLAFDLEQQPSADGSSAAGGYRLTTTIDGQKYQLRPSSGNNTLITLSSAVDDDQWPIEIINSGNTNADYAIGYRINGTLYYLTYGALGTSHVYLSDSESPESVRLYKHREVIDAGINAEYGTSYNKTTKRVTAVARLKDAKRKIYAICPASAGKTQTVTLMVSTVEFDKLNESHKVYIITKPANSPVTCIVNTYDSYYEMKFTVSSQDIGKSMKFDILAAQYFPSGNEVIVADYQDFTVEFISEADLYWTYNESRVENPAETLTVEYAPYDGVSSPFKLFCDKGIQNPDRTIQAATVAPRRTPDGYALGNYLGLRFSSENETSTIRVTGSTQDFLNIVGTYPTLTLSVTPYKPKLELSGNSITHDGGSFAITIPKGSFEPADGNKMYARILLEPQFDTFDNVDAATEHFGNEPREGVKDSWLCHTWYKGQDLTGFLPEMQWEGDHYVCYLDPADLSLTKLNGTTSFSDHLVSGHYKLQVIPSNISGSRQYGIVPSDPVDLYICPTHKDMKLGLCIRDEEKGDPYWKYYNIAEEGNDEMPNGSTEHGMVAYAHATLLPAADFCDIYYKVNEPKKQSHAPALRAANGQIPEGYTKLEPGDYLDLSNSNNFNVLLTKNGAVNPSPMAVSLSKNGDEIITGIEAVAVETADGSAEYFTTSGVKIDYPSQPGVYIERRAGKTRKIALH